METLLARIRAFASESHQEVARTSAYLQAMIGAMAGVPGRKALLYIGGGISLNPGQVLYTALQNAFSRYTQTGQEDPTAQLPVGIFMEETDELAALADAASVNRVALYTVDAGGLEGSASFSSARGPSEVGTGASPAREDAWSPGLSFSRRSDLQSSLQLLSKRTGGTTLVNSRRFSRAFETLAGDFASYYSLGFQPAGDSTRPHRMDLQVRRKGARLRYRDTFRAKGSDEIAGDRTLAALSAGIVNNALGARLEPGEARVAADDRLLVPLSIQIPLSAIAVEANGQEHTGQISIFFATGHDNLPDGPVRKAVFPVRIPNHEILAAMGRILDYRVDLEMTPGAGQIAIGIRDDLDPRLSTLTMDVEVAAPTAGSPK